MKIPVTVFMGYLGSGKTTIILNLLKQFDGKENIVMLKNEFGDVAVDSKLAQGDHVKVKEILNGCLCCVLVGKLQNALNEILDKYSPDRIIFESSGTAYPAPIVWEINKNERLKTDGVVTVIDALNFTGYKDKSYTAELQAKYTDLILVNKISLVNEKELDKVLDEVYELNPTTPKIKTADGFVDAELVFGLSEKNKNSLVELIEKNKSHFDKTHDHEGNNTQDSHEHIETFSFRVRGNIEQKKLVDILSALSPSVFFRIKGFFADENNKTKIINYVFGRTMIEPIQDRIDECELVFMGREIKNIEKDVIEKLNLAVVSK